LLFVANFTPIARDRYRIGVPQGGVWHEIANSDAEDFGGSGIVNGEVQTDTNSTHGYDFSLELTLPPLSALFLAPGSDGS